MATMDILPLFILVCFASMEWAWAGSSSVNHFVVNVPQSQSADSHTQEFLDAWNAACWSESEYGVVTVPAGRILTLNPSKFQGPCKATNIHLQIFGTIAAPGVGAWNNKDRTTWLEFINATTGQFTIDGGGSFNGRGAQWWPLRRRGENTPVTLRITNSQHVVVKNLKFIDSGNWHLCIYGSSYVTVSHITISSPGDSPNTDGINMASSQHVKILDSTIGTGDDCIAIGPGSSDLTISGITCGPGHGISIGSLGANSEVSTIHISNSQFIETTNGARIKTKKGGSGHATGITFEQLNFTRVQNPVIIDQSYCPDGKCGNQPGNVQVSNVRFVGLQGSSASEVAIALACSERVPCNDIYMENVQLRPASRVGHVTSYCINAHGSSKAPVNPNVPCLT